MKTPSLAIRQIGDPVLQVPPPQADVSQTATLMTYLAVLQKEQQQNGGIGIACNQCVAIAEPVAVVLLGTDDPATRAAAALRYPGETIPTATLMINPQILRYGEETYYPAHGEGCLSVAGPLRGKVKRHRRVRVRYQTLEGATLERDSDGMEAHIIQHECDHLQGIVYLQRIFADCSGAQKEEIIRLLGEEAAYRQCEDCAVRAKAVEPLLVFERDGDAVVFDPARLLQALAAMPDDTLDGIRAALE
ncbi:MAG: peptide deformylase [Paludibacterium sp.]|uniref:peptide deformylase n=1 Tax=Paludibacterium sp. TaxID=1917523 RepID=UPI0025F1AE34|nr:peptide deformylase [Paludibacterium sp.]MBV8046707.1 peptide deformylase [Paludibacterium sp.]